MGIALITIKLMPESLEANLEEIKERAKEIIESNKGTKVRFEEEPIAFGLKAVIVYFEQDEEEGELSPIEEGLTNLQNIQSAQVTDTRRAFG